MLTCSLRRVHQLVNDSTARRCGNTPGSGFICDLNGKIEHVVSKRVARSSSEMKLRCEPISILSEQIEGVTYKWKINYGNNFEPQITLSYHFGDREAIKKTHKQTWAVGDTKGVMLLRISTADPIKKLRELSLPVRVWRRSE